MSKQLFLAWQDPEDRVWYPVGRLTVQGSRYRFVYTQGARSSRRFIPLGNMQDLDKVYESTELFPLFSNRLLSRSRPEYRLLLDWLNLTDEEADPMQLLALTEGIRKTDTLTVFPCPDEGKDGSTSIRFFGHGIRYLPPEAIKRVNALEPGVRLYLMLDIQNQFDEYAIALRTEDPKSIVGYCPRYLARDFRQLLSTASDGEAEIFVERVNREAPIQMRMLCTLTTPWPEGFRPCQGGDYTPLA